nr:hypothetical protein [Streptomyces sp. NBC_01549]
MDAQQWRGGPGIGVAFRFGEVVRYVGEQVQARAGGLAEDAAALASSWRLVRAKFAAAAIAPR